MINRHIIVAGLGLVLCALFTNTAASGIRGSGETLYRRHCASCHPIGSSLKGATNIVGIMRNPVPFMPRFDKTKISDEDAREIRDYILQFKTGK